MQTTGTVATFSTTQEFKDALKTHEKDLTVIEFSASWCGYCELMEPVMTEYATKYNNVHFINIDWDEMRDVARDYRVRGFPTFILSKNGKTVAKIVGAKKEELDKKITQYKD